MAKRLLTAVFLCLALFSGHLSGQDKLLDQPLRLEMRKGTVGEFLYEIESLTNVRMAWASNHLHLSRQLSLSGQEKSLGDHLNTVLEGEYVRIVVRKNHVVLAQSSKPLQRAGQQEVNRWTLQGQIREKGSGEALIGAAVYELASGVGTYTNDYGFFSITLPEGPHLLNFQYVGYTTQTREFDFTQAREIDIRLEANLEIEVVEIESTDEQQELHDATLMGRHTLSMEKEGSLPVLLGEADILKTMQLLPGVHGGSDGASGIFVRGGGSDQNLINLDGVPIYNANHVVGVVSVFNSAAINSASIQKGAFPARYSGRLSSFVDVHMKEGNMEKFQGEVGLGLLSGRVSLEGPLIKNKTSFFLSGRRTWLDLLTVPAQALFSTSETNYFFHDLNAKINHRISDKDRVYLSGYIGRDKINLKNVLYQAGSDSGKDRSEIGWGNQLGSLRWNHIFGSRLFANTTLTYSRYNFAVLQEVTQNEDSSWFQKLRFDAESSIQDWAGRVDFDYFPNPNHAIRFGAGTIYHTFSPSTTSLDQVFLNRDTSIAIAAAQQYAHEPFVYLDDDIRISERLRINPGLHFAGYFVGSERYLNLQPRFSSRYMFDAKNSVKFSYGRMAQFIHLLTNPGIGISVDLWVPSTEKVRPATSHQFSLGYYRTLSPQINLRAEVFYKQMNNLLEYREGYNYVTNSPDWEDQVESGQGWSYGGELMLEKHKGKLTGWLSYTWSKAERKFENLNFGNTFPFRYDRRHDLNVAMTYAVNKKLSFGAVWIYGTGNAVTLGINRFFSLPTWPGNSGIQLSPPEERNNYRTPPYHRLDLSMNLDKTTKIGERRWSFGIYNAYNRINPTFLFSYPKTDGTVGLYKQGLLPILPFAAYRIRF